MPKIVSNLWFDTQALEAAEFYVSLFPGSAVTNVVRYTSAGPGPEGSILTVDFHLDGTPFTAINGGPQFTFDAAVSFLIECADQAEIDRYWAALTDGGEGGHCGWLTDRYGLSWQVVPAGWEKIFDDADPVAAARATEAMFTMSKLDLAALQAAFGGTA